MILSFDPDAHPCHALHQSQNTGLVCVLFADDRIDLPMTEFHSEVYNFGPFIDAPTEISLVFADFFGFRAAPELFRQVDVFDGEQTEIHVLEKILPDTVAFVLDMENLEYISSAGLRVILKAQKAMNTKGTMKLIHVGESIKKIIDITGFSDFQNIE